MGEGDRARLEAWILDRLERGLEVRLEDLRGEFPPFDESELEGALVTCRILFAWFERERRGEELPAPGPDAADWLTPGERIGGYVVLARIPGGGMGQVYQATQESLHPRRVALKVHRLGERPEAELRRARREAEVASRLVHPNLVAVHDMGRDGERGLVWFSMQYVDGPDLRSELLGRSPLRQRAAVRRLVTRVSEVAGALADLHGRGYVHRDVKPENILLRRNAGRDGRGEAAVLVDFGLARAESALRGTHALAAGTPGYAPPESDRPGAGATPAWDVFSLGVVLFELLAGRPLGLDGEGAPRRPDPADVRALRGRRGALDADLAAVLSRAIAADSDQRYANAGELQADLEAWLAGRDVAARRPPFPERLARGARRQPRRALLVASCALLGILYALLVTEDLRAVRAGSRALNQGALLAGWTRLQSARLPVLRGLLLGDPALERELRTGADQHPVAQVARAQRERGSAQAFELAAAFLARDGLAEHPRLVAFSTAALAGADERERGLALRAAALLFFEVPVEDPARLALAAPFVERALGILRSPASTREDRLHAACVIGGAGGPQELGAVLEWMAASTSDVEAQRLGTRSLERIVRRVRGVEPDVERWVREWGPLEGTLEERVLEIARLSSSEPLLDPLQYGIRHLLTAWAHLQRAVGRPAGWAEGVLTHLDSDSRRAVRAAIAGPLAPSVAEEIWAEFEREFESGRIRRRAWAFVFGRHAGYLADARLRIQLEARLAEEDRDHPGHGLLAGFREGLELARVEAERGLDPSQLPHPSSRLVRRFDPAPAPEPLDLELIPRPDLPAGTAAHWYLQPPLQRAARAGVPTLGGGAYWHAGTWANDDHLRLPRAGAWIELPFELDAPVSSYAGFVELDHLAATRFHLPFMGQAWIRVELNGTLLAERLLVDFVGGRSQRLSIEGTILSPGTNRLRLEAVEATTTYWLHHASIVFEQQKPKVQEPVGAAGSGAVPGAGR